MSSPSERAAKLAGRAREAAPDLTPQQVLAALKRLDMNMQALARDPRGVDIAVKAIRGVIPRPVRWSIREHRVRSVVEAALLLYAQRGEAALADGPSESVMADRSADVGSTVDAPEIQSVVQDADRSVVDQADAPTDFRDHFLGVLQLELDRRWAHEMEVSQNKLERAKAAPYQHDAAVEQELARLQRCQQAIEILEQTKDEVRRMPDSSYDELKAFTDAAMTRAFEVLYGGR